MKNIFKYILTIALGALIFTSCDDLNEPIIWEGLEVGFEHSTSRGDVDVRSTDDITVEIPIMLIGAQQGSDVTVHVGINHEATTATYETMYTIPNQDVVIPANSSFGTLSVNIVRSGFVQAGEEYEVHLVLTEASAKIGIHFSTHILNIKTIKPYDINDFVGTYTVNESNTDGEPQDPYEITLAKKSETTTDTIVVSGLWDSSTSDIDVVLNSEDNTLEIPVQENFYTTTYEGLVTYAKITSRDYSSAATGTFENGGGPIIINGYLAVITNGPYTDYNWLPGIGISTWTKNESK